MSAYDQTVSRVPHFEETAASRIERQCDRERRDQLAQREGA